jgi:hypothetical protein
VVAVQILLGHPCCGVIWVLHQRLQQQHHAEHT